MLLQEERELVVEYGRRMRAERLSPGTSGNLSIYSKTENLMAISPSGMDYDAITPADVVVTDLSAHRVDGSRNPSSEWALHTLFYQTKPDIRAVVHTHSLYCTTFAVLGRPIQAVHYVIGDAGAMEIPCAPYRLFGTEELAETAVRTCGRGNAVLLANHGLVVCGKDMPAAWSLACNVEYLAELQYRALCIGTPQVLSEDQMAAVLERFQSYGQ